MRGARRPSALADLAPGTRATFVRISDSDPEMLRYLAERGIAPGDDFEVIDKQPFDGPIFARFGDDVHVLGGALARAMRARGGRVTDAGRRAPARRAACSSCSRAGACAARSPCSARRSSPASPTSTPATSPPTSPAAPSTATCCCGSCSRANLMAMLIQNLSAKIGIATGRNLPELCRDHFPRPVDLGPVGPGRAHRHGHRPGRVRRRRDRAEPALPRAALPGRASSRRSSPSAILGAAGARATGASRPSSPGCSGSSSSASSTTRCASASTPARPPRASSRASPAPTRCCWPPAILGATVMPHVIYLHSALTQDRVPPRDDAERKRLLRFQRIDVSLAMGLAGPGQHVDARHRRLALPRRRPAAAWTRSRRPTRSSAALAGGGAALAFAARAAGLGPGLVERGDLRRAGRHAGLHRAHDPDRPAPAGDDDAGADRARHRPEPVALAGHLAGRAELRDPVRARPARPAHAGARTSWARSSTAG